MSKKSWNQPVCDECWPSRHDRTPTRMSAEHRETETCAFCGEPTRSGIYERVDPDDPAVKYPTWE